jgi:hypothetical protein
MALLKGLLEVMDWEDDLVDGDGLHARLRFAIFGMTNDEVVNEHRIGNQKIKKNKKYSWCRIWVFSVSISTSNPFDRIF